MADVPQLQPPPIPPWFVPRPHLFGLLEGVLHHRLTLVVAGPGYGKSTILAAWGLAMGCVWYAAPAGASTATFARGLAGAFRRRLPALRADLEAALQAGGDREDPAHAELLAGLLCEALDPIVRSDLPLVLDTAEHLGGAGTSLRFVEALCRQAPPTVHLVLASRSALPLELASGTQQTLGPSDLAFSVEETAALLASTVGPIEEEAATALHARTGGWPAALRLVVETLQNAPPARGAELLGSADPALHAAFAPLADEALRLEPPEVLALLSRMALFERSTPQLCYTLGIADARRLLDPLIRRGLFVLEQGGPEGWLSLHTLLREYAQDRWPLAGSERRRLRVRAGDWFAEHGYVEDALQALEAAEDPVALAAFLVRHGEALLEGGHGGHLLRAGTRIPPAQRSPELETVLGWAHRLRGDWDEAFEHYRRAAHGRRSLPVPLAWRIAEAHYLRSELAEAIDAAERAERDGAVSDHDLVMLLTWEASARRRTGDRERALHLARAAREIAERTGDPEDVAASFTTELGILDLPVGDPVNEARDLAALEAAKAAGNVWLRVRLLTNRAEALAFQGRFEEAGDLTRVALELAETSGDPFSIARVLEIRAAAALGEGRLIETVNDARAARALYERVGSQMTAQASLLLGHAHRETGELAAAHAAYEHALRIGRDTSNTDIVQEALAGQVRLLALEDPAEARRVADRALAIQGGPTESRCQVALSAGWAALAAGDHERALGLAEETARIARSQSYGTRLAEAVELTAMAAPEPDRPTLQRALEIWRGVGHAVGVARVTVALAMVGPEPPGDRPDVAAALRDLRALGVRPAAAAGAGGLLALLPSPREVPLLVRTLGGFAVLRDGTPVPFSEWKSRKARDLLKILIARRGVPTHREFLMEALWPGEPADRLSNRLSVALAILRAVLDPTHRSGGQHFVTGEADSVRLNIDRITVDVERFLRAAREALQAPQRAGGAGPEDLSALEDAEALYAGDFLEEDPYEDWATALREEAKSLYIEVGRELTVRSFRAGRHEAAVRYGLPILSRDPFDEVAHLLIVRALAASGRHGEARRRYRMYVGALEELGVPPGPYPAAGVPTPSPGMAR